MQRCTTRPPKSRAAIASIRSWAAAARSGVTSRITENEPYSARTAAGVSSSSHRIRSWAMSMNPAAASSAFRSSAASAIPNSRGSAVGGSPRYDGAWTATTYFDATEGRGLPDDNGKQFLPSKTIAQPAFWLHNVRLAYRVPDGSLELAGWVRNVSDKPYKTFAFDGTTFNRTSIFFVGDPRTYGLTLTAQF